MAKKQDCLRMKRERERVKEEMMKQQEATASNVVDFTSEGQQTASQESSKNRAINKAILDVSNKIKEEKAKEAEPEKVEPVEVDPEPEAEVEAKVESEEPLTSQEIEERIEEAKQCLARNDKKYSEFRNNLLDALSKYEEDLRQARIAEKEAQEKARAEEELKMAAREAAKLDELEAAESSKKVRVGTAYRYWDPELKAKMMTFDMWVANQASPGNWEQVYVLIEGGQVIRELSNAELAERYAI